MFIFGNKNDILFLEIKMILKQQLTCSVAVARHTVVSCPLVVVSFLAFFTVPPFGVSLAVYTVQS